MTDSNFIQEMGEEFAGMSKAEIQAYLQFEKKYHVMYPPPEKSKSSLGWEFNASVLVAASSMVLAAFRTGDAFYKAAFAQGSTIFAAAEAIVAVIAIEGAVVLTAVRNSANKEIAENATSKELLTTNELNVVGFWIALGLSMLAGLFQSVGVVESIANSGFATFLSWLLIIFMGLGATTIAALAGNDLGVRLVALRLAGAENEQTYQRAVRSYRGRLMKAWYGSSELSSVENVKQTRYKRTSKQTDSEQTSKRTANKQTRANKPVRTREQTNRSKLITDLLLATYNEQTRVAGVTEIAEILARAETDDPLQVSETIERTKGYISQVRKRWMQENGLEE